MGHFTRALPLALEALNHFTVPVDRALVWADVARAAGGTPPRAGLMILQQDGWYLVRTRGSHHQYRHAAKAGVVTVPGAPNDDLAIGTYFSILKQAGLKRRVTS